MTPASPLPRLTTVDARPLAPTPPATKPGATVGGAEPAPPAGPGRGDVILEAMATAAEQVFDGRAVDVDSYYDEASARVIYRVADRFTGEVVLETPPEELLRFFASSREAARAPMLTVDA